MGRLRPDVELNNFRIMRVNLYEEASLGLPSQQGVETTRFVKKGTVVARTVSGDEHYADDIDSMTRIVCSDLSTARKFPVTVTAEKNSHGVKFTFKS